MKRILLAVILSLAILPCFSQEDPKKLIDENKIWEYLTQRYYTSTLEKYVFAGTEEVEGQTYHKLTLISKEVYENTTQQITNSFPNEVVALLRETDDGKVYKLLKEGDKYRDFDGDNLILSKEILVETPKEFLLYDFNPSRLKFKSCISLFMCEGSPIVSNVMANCRINRKEGGVVNQQITDKFIFTTDIYPWCMKYGIEPTLEDREYEGDPEYIFEDFDVSPDYSLQTEIIYVRGIGNVGGGDMVSLHSISPLIRTSGLLDLYFKKLNNVYNRDGDIIYKGTNYSFPTPASAIINEIDSKEFPIYDLFGREIRNPQPGTIYIRNGKKFIAK